MIPARLAAELAGITYRQLDYWARQGWVRPSIEAGVGRAGRRLYGRADVIRLAALGWFGRAGLDVGRLGPIVAVLAVPAGSDFVVAATIEGEVASIEVSEWRARLCRPVPQVVFDPYTLAGAIDGDPAVTVSAGADRLAVGA